jgi:hypothetical protein
MKNLRIVLMIAIQFCASALLFAERQSAFVEQIQGAGHLVATSQTSDGGYVMVTYKDDPDSLTINKLSDSGERLWKNSFQLSNGSQELIVSGISEASDGYLLSGRLQGNTHAGLLIKLNTAGKLVWSKSTSRPLQTAIAQPDGTFLTLGLTGNPHQPVLMKFGPGGNILWSKGFSKLNPNDAIHSSPTPDNGLLVAITRYKMFGDGYAHSYRVDLSRLTTNGDIEWAQSLRMNDFYIQRIRVTSSGNILLISEFRFGSQVVNVNKNGHIQSASGYFPNEEISGGYLQLNDAVQTPDGGNAFVGILSPDWMCGCGDAFILKTDRNGKILFEKRIATGTDFSGNPVSAEFIFSTKEKGYVIFAQAYEHDAPDGTDRWSQLLIGVNSKLQVSGCNSLVASDISLVEQQHMPKITISKLDLKPSVISFNNIRDLNLKSVKVEESIEAICK